MIGDEKITKDHLGRRAVVYVRQSTPNQVRNHRESLRVQRGLAEKVRELGFRDVEVIEDDLGRSGSGLQERPGFGRLLASVCDGAVGIVTAFESARLSRNNRDWYHLLDLCALTDTLVADAEKVYDPRSLDDRLLLGLKGAMSEFEVGLFRQRGRAALLQMIHRGEVLTEVPVGYVRTEDNRCEMTPDRQVREAVHGVFRKFRELGSARQVLLFFRGEEIPLPTARPGRAGREVLWELPIRSRIVYILKNPVYAGAFVYGRTRSRTKLVEGRGRKTPGHAVPMEEWQVLIRDHHEGYISWADYLRNQEVLEANANMEGRMATGAAKKGTALLSGLLRCRRCGRRFHVLYSGGKRTIARYQCRGGEPAYGTRRCISFAARTVDAAVSEVVLQALAPAGIEAALAAWDLRLAEEDEKRTSVRLALERARYEADRARRQYDLAEPENRLVSAELETRWNLALQRVAQIERDVDELNAAVEPVPEWERERLMHLGADLEGAWSHQEAPVQMKKKILRTVLEGIVADVREEPPEVDLTIRWAGGMHTKLAVPKRRTGCHRHVTNQNLVHLVERLAAICPDKDIARHLNRLGYRTGCGNTWNRGRVLTLRRHRKRRIPAFDPDAPRTWINLSEAVDTLGVSEATVRRFIQRGILPARQAAPGTPWVIQAEDVARESVRRAAEAVQQGRKAPPSAPGQTQLPLKPSD